jgi:hypothetical protein
MPSMATRPQFESLRVRLRAEEITPSAAEAALVLGGCGTTEVVP